MDKDFKFPFYVKASLVFIGLFAFISMLFFTQRIIVPLIYSTIIAIVLSPMVDFLVRKKINRLGAIAFTLILVIFLTIFIFALLSSQFMQFSDSFPKLVERFNQLTHQTVAWASDNFNISAGKIDSWITSKNADILDSTSSTIGQTLIHTGSMLVILVLIPVYVFMILYYQHLLLEFIHKLFKSSDQDEVSEVLSAAKKIIRSYLVGLLLEAAIIAILNSACLLMLGIEYAILMGVIGAMVNVIPYIGGIVAVALPMLVAFVTKSSASYCLLVLAAYILIQFVDNHYIIPKIVASKVKINALISIIVVLAGGALWGIPGMFLSIPLTAIIKVIFDHIESLKPWGYLLGDTMPRYLGMKLPFKKMTTKS
jgi:predicted PurR-regulated permease PerM